MVQLMEVDPLNCEVRDSRRFEVVDEHGHHALGDREVQVWHYNLDVDAELETTLARHLNDEENDRAARFRFAKHKRRFIARRATLRIILSQYAGCEPKALRFKYGEHGKPYIAWPHSAGNIRFSATNSHGLGGVAITKCCELGLDFEQVLPDGDQKLIASTQFSSEENDWLLHLPESKRLVAFYELWTSKEAYLKGKGLGVTVPLSHFAVSVNPGAPQLAWSDIDRTDPQHWSLHRLVIEPGFIACLAINLSYHAVHRADSNSNN